MKPKPLKIKIIPFKEHPIVDYSQSDPDNFDISAIGLNYPASFVMDKTFSLEAYCEALLHKISQLSKTEIKYFIDYQCKILKDPVEWLDQLELLIDDNFDYFDKDDQRIKVNKLYFNIQFNQGNVKNRSKTLVDNKVNFLATNNPVRFDFNQVKSDLVKLGTFNEKKAYLIELKANYLESENILSISNKSICDKFIDIELDKLNKLQEIIELPQTQNPSKQAPKIRINGKTNILVDVFYRLLYEFMPEGKPFIDNTPTEVARMITDNFVNRDGKPISLSSVQTMLNPGKVDKRPVCDKRFCMKHLLPVTFFFEIINLVDFQALIDLILIT